VVVVIMIVSYRCRAQQQRVQMGNTKSGSVAYYTAQAGRPRSEGWLERRVLYVIMLLYIFIIYRVVTRFCPQRPFSYHTSTQTNHANAHGTDPSVSIRLRLIQPHAHTNGTHLALREPPISPRSALTKRV